MEHGQGYGRAPNCPGRIGVATGVARPRNSTSGVPLSPVPAVTPISHVTQTWPEPSAASPRDGQPVAYP